MDGGWVTGAGAGAELVVAGAAFDVVVGAGETPPEVEVGIEAVVAALWWAGLCFLCAGSVFFLVVAVVVVVAAAFWVELVCEVLVPPQPAIASAAAVANRDFFIPLIPPRSSFAGPGYKRLPL